MRKCDMFLKKQNTFLFMSRMRTYTSITFLFLFIALLIPQTSAEIVFDEYITTARITDGVIHVQRDVVLRNAGAVPIIPGELHFRFFERNGDRQQAIPITAARAQNEQGDSLNTNVNDRGRETDISVQIWNPLLPGFTYSFTLFYEIDFAPRGILFYELRLPREQTTIRILNEETRFELDRGYRVTFAPESQVSRLSGNTVITWDESSEQRIVEFSRLPFPKTSLRGVNLFWITIILLLLAVFVLSVLKQRKEPSRKEPPYSPQRYQ